MYLIVQKINQFRKDNKIWNLDQVQRYADDQFYAFTRGTIFVAFTNNDNYISRKITYHPYKEGDVLCNLFWPQDCVVIKNGSFDAVLLQGEFKIFSLSKKSHLRDIQ